MPDVLRHLPGITLSNSGGVGKATSVFIRGTNSSHVLVLVDGVKVGSATTGSVAFEDLPLDQVERIEVVRGPRSSLYGSEAIGGVIQIFTRKGGNGFQPELSASVGSHNTQKANVNLAGGDATTWYNVNAGTEQTDGFNATANNQEPDADGYERDSLSLRAGTSFRQRYAGWKLPRSTPRVKIILTVASITKHALPSKSCQRQVTAFPE